MPPAAGRTSAFNSGPILSPRFFAERIMPHMAPVMRLLRQHGIDVIWTDCDGNILKLIPLWLGVGLNCMFPLEVNPGNDPVALKQEYGRELLIRGGFDKFALHQGREAVLKELKRLEPVGGRGRLYPARRPSLPRLGLLGHLLLLYLGKVPHARLARGADQGFSVLRPLEGHVGSGTCNARNGERYGDHLVRWRLFPAARTRRHSHHRSLCPGGGLSACPG